MSRDLLADRAVIVLLANPIVAAEHLQQAGLKDEANALREESERMVKTVEIKVTELQHAKQEQAKHAIQSSGTQLKELSSSSGGKSSDVKTPLSLAVTNADRLETNFEVIHMTQFLLNLIEEGRLEIKGSFERTGTYHDPCYLGRHNDIFDEPREILNRIPGLTLEEMADNRFERELSRPQMELVAARTSAINECFY